MVTNLVYRKVISNDSHRRFEGFIEITDGKISIVGAPSLEDIWCGNCHQRQLDQISLTRESTFLLLHDPLSHVNHYGTSVFEGIRVKWDDNEGTLNVIQLEDHIRRLRKSLEALVFSTPQREEEMPPSEVQRVLRRFNSTLPGEPVFFNPTVADLREKILATIYENLVRGYINPYVVNPEGRREGRIYVRPVVYRNGHPTGKLGVYSLSHDIVFEIICQEWPAYLTNPTLIVYREGVEDPLRKYKCGSNYGFGGQAKNKAMAAGFGDALLTDRDPRRNVQEATGANLHAYYDDETFYTAPIEHEHNDEGVVIKHGQLMLPGTRRKLTREIGKNLGFRMRLKDIPLDELMEEAKLVFLTGTATGTEPISYIYDPTTGNGREYSTDLEPYQRLRAEFNAMLEGGPLQARANEELRRQIRTRVELPH